MHFLSASFFYVILVLLLLTYLYYTKKNNYGNFFKNFPTPPTELFFGNARAFTSTSVFLKLLHKYTKEYGSIFHLKIGPTKDMIVCSDYDFLQFVLNDIKSFKKSRNIMYLRPWIGDGLVTSEGERWKNRGKLIAPAFHFKILEKFVDIFDSSSDVLVANLSKLSGSQSVDIHSYIARCSLDIICETAMGTKIDAQSNESSEYFQGVKEICRIFITRTMSILGSYDFCFRFTKDFLKQERALQYMHGYHDNVIETKHKEFEKNKINPNRINNSEDAVIMKKKKAFLDLLLEAADKDKTFSFKDIRDEVSTFMFAGHDTTAAASSFILYCLANHKSVQDKVLEEQKRIFGDVKDPKFSYSNLQNMQYLDCVIKEGMRVLTPVPYFGRESTQEVNYNGIIIPKGVIFIIFTHGLHMNSEYYPNPEKFDPSRFEKTQEKQPFAYMPFGYGPRICIGLRYAMLEIKCMVAKIIRNFELYPAVPHHNMDLAGETVLRSLNGVRVGLKLR